MLFQPKLWQNIYWSSKIQHSLFAYLLNPLPTVCDFHVFNRLASLRRAQVKSNLLFSTHSEHKYRVSHLKMKMAGELCFAPQASKESSVNSSPTGYFKPSKRIIRLD
jgi:hypothetical protein